MKYGHYILVFVKSHNNPIAGCEGYREEWSVDMPPSKVLIKYIVGRGRYIYLVHIVEQVDIHSLPKIFIEHLDNPFVLCDIVKRILDIGR
jgi:hypothetical protein